jgi:hypothetical protein
MAAQVCERCLMIHVIRSRFHADGKRLARRGTADPRAVRLVDGDRGRRMTGAYAELGLVRKGLIVHGQKGPPGDPVGVSEYRPPNITARPLAWHAPWPTLSR